MPHAVGGMQHNLYILRPTPGNNLWLRASLLKAWSGPAAAAASGNLSEENLRPVPDPVNRN